MNSYDPTEAQAAFALGTALGEAKSPLNLPDAELADPSRDGTPYVVLPSGYSVADLERLLPAPTRKRADVVLTDTESLIAYLGTHATPASSTVYAVVDSEQSRFALVCVLDDHHAAAPQWRGHRCSLTPKQSVEWKRWTGSDRVKMAQSDFAAWLEDNRGDVASVAGMPSGAEILAMALGFEATADKRLRSKINLGSGGVAFEYVDDEDKETRTKMQVFERFTLGLPVFYGSADAYPLEARLKYRNTDGKLTFWYELVRPDRIFQQAVDFAVQRVTSASGVQVLYGNPGV